MSEALNAKKLLGVYEELGYPKKHFNDSLIYTLGNLMDTPVIKAPIKLVHPSVYYQLPAPDLEVRSAGPKQE